MRHRFFRIVPIVLLCFLLSGCGKQQESVNDQNGDGKLTCTLEICCGTVLDHPDTLVNFPALPADGVMLPETEYEFTAGDSVYAVLEHAAQEADLELRTKNSVGTTYILSIGGLSEFDFGGASGWVYSVNDDFPTVGCSSVTLQDGDAVRFLYTCDAGVDVHE